MDRAIDGPLKICPVSELVNSPKTDDHRCIEPAKIDRNYSSVNGGGGWIIYAFMGCWRYVALHLTFG
jgi:hypothetical protein